MKRRTFYFLVCAVVLIGYLVSDILIAAGAFKSIEPHGDRNFQTMQLEVAGPEDLTLDRVSGNLFISADDRRTNQKSPGVNRGAILLLNVRDSVQKIKNITPAEPADFHPHGISIWKSDSGRIFLFVVNHAAKQRLHTIERFEFSGDSLLHLESIQDGQLMTSPNDVYATGEHTFYVTNDHYYADEGIGRTLEDYLQRAISFVNYFDGEKFRTVATGIAYANGIQGNRDGSEIYIASTTGRKILVYDVQPSTGDLKLKNEIDAETGVDNIELDENGSLIIGCHPQLLKFVAHAASADNFSPSQIIRLSPTGSGNFLRSEVFLNNGTAYSGSTTGIQAGNQLYVGSVFEPTLLRVTIDDRNSSPRPY